MSQTVVYILLILALILPVLGALILRVLESRLAPGQLYGTAAAILGVALVSVFLLARSDVPSLQLGGLSILLPVTAPDDDDLNIPLPDVAELPTSEPAAATAAPAVTPAVVGTAAPVATSIPPTAAPTETPTEAPTEAPTVTPEPTAAPTEAPTEAPAPPQQRRYTVEPGDTLRSIAERFEVTVPALLEANNLTPEEADSLRVGQELIIP